MGVVDDLRNGLTEDSDADLYVVTETRYDGSDHLATIDPARVRELLREYPDACRAFRIANGAGYDHSPSVNRTYSQAEHAGRVETDVAAIADEISDHRTVCSVRLDTTDPQLVTIEDDTVRAQIEIDDSVVRWVPPVDNPQTE